ncbi:MAG: hypothetical protein ACXWCP_16250, partial [Burkholderiales bacterium]
AHEPLDLDDQAALDSTHEISHIATHSLAAVLFPATPPKPPKARVIRRFGIEDKKRIAHLAVTAKFGRK